ncbi:MAG TPA: mitofilin family membrane protein [Stellaceae bacterium]
MSEAAPEPPTGEAPQSPPPRPAPILSGWRGAVAIGFATALIVFGLLVISGPFWAPAISPLFSAGAAPSADTPLADRLAQLEAAQRNNQQKIDQAVAAAQKAAADSAASAQQLDRRIAAIENKPAASSNELAELRQQVKALESRPTAAAGDIAELRQQMKALEAKPAAAPPELADLRQQVQQLTAANADLGNRVAALEKGEHAQSAADPTDTTLLLALLQIREAIETARPFAAEYDALTALAKTRPDIAAAAAPLAEPAKSGVASRAVLIERLRALRGAIATAQPAPAEGDWAARAWAQLRGLVTIRRIDGAGQSAAEAAVGAAERALAAGDLAGVVAALEGLAGPAADAAQPWLQMVRQRLAAEEALHRMQSLLVARLGPVR